MTTIRPPGASTPLAARKLNSAPARKRTTVELPPPTAAEQDAFGKIYKRLRLQLEKLARSMLPAYDPEDIVADATLKVWLRRDGITRCKGDPECELGHFAMAVINRAINLYKKLKGEKQGNGALANDALTREEESEPQLQQITGGELQWHIDRAIAKMPYGRRRVFQMVAVDEAKYWMAAHFFGISENTVSVHVTEGHKFICQELAKVGLFDLPKPRRGKKEHKR